MASTKKNTTKKTPEAQAPEVTDLKEQQQDATPEVQPEAQAPEVQEKDPEATPEAFTPYEATVAIPLAVLRRGTAPRPEDKPIGTLTRGDRVSVTGSVDGYAMLANGTYVKEAYLERKD